MKEENVLNMSVAEANDFLMKKGRWRKGGMVCPCCEQLAFVYKRTFYARSAVSLIALYHCHIREPDIDFFHVSMIGKASQFALQDLAKGAWWGFIENKPKKDESGGKTSGLWKITPKGVAFVKGRLKIKTYALIYNSHVLGFDGDERGIKECLGDKFDYNSLMTRG